jgi:hypothetical protein
MLAWLERLGRVGGDANGSPDTATHHGPPFVPAICFKRVGTRLTLISWIIWPKSMAGRPVRFVMDTSRVLASEAR